MVKELYQIKVNEVTLNVTNSEIDSVRKKNLTKSGCRVYDNGCIGIAGTLGEPTEETWQKAEKALNMAIAYPFEPNKNLVAKRVNGEWLPESELIAKAERVLKILKEEFPEFILSNKIIAQEETISLKNDAGLDLFNTQNIAQCALIVKEEASPNVFDSVIAWDGSEFDEEEIISRGRELLRAHLNLLPMPTERVPVLFSFSTVSGILGDYLHAQKLKKDASLLSGKEGQKVFAEKLTLFVDRNDHPNAPFFDAEGTVLPNDRMTLIDKGVVVRGIADKLCADEFGMELTACAEGGYDDVPSLYVNPYALQLESSGTLKEILGGRNAIYLGLADGGDITPAGDYASPVQTAYLYRDGKLIGRLPEFNIRGNIFKMLGEDYVGTSSDGPIDSTKLTAVYCQIDG
ncbi:MAG: hypothetical protein E7467_03840 [Ruminococcaceae bacterium]|nr:hypothetical protein [Oscillospiraceae bacterium]